jgi:hypothetical protein
MITTVIRIQMYKIQKALYVAATGIGRCTIQKVVYMTASGIRRCIRQKALYVTINRVRMHMFWNTEFFISDNRWHMQVYSENGLHWVVPDVDGRIILRRIFRKWEGLWGLDGAGSG